MQRAVRPPSGGGAGNRLKGAATPLPPNTPALTLPQRHSHTPTPAPNRNSNRQKPPPNRFHVPYDRSATALGLPR